MSHNVAAKGADLHAQNEGLRIEVDGNSAIVLCIIYCTVAIGVLTSCATPSFRVTARRSREHCSFLVEKSGSTRQSKCLTATSSKLAEELGSPITMSKLLASV